MISVQFHDRQQFYRHGLLQISHLFCLVYEQYAFHGKCAIRAEFLQTILRATISHKRKENKFIRKFRGKHGKFVLNYY